MTFISIILLAGLTLLAISLQRTYGSLPVKELKKRARSGDVVAEKLHKAAAYGPSLRALLWTAVVVFGALFFIVLSNATEGWFAFLVGSLGTENRYGFWI